MINRRYLSPIMSSILIMLFLSGTNVYGQEKVSLIELGGLKRFFKVNDSIYRSAQPSKKEFGLLEDYGIKTVLNLRRNVKDDKKASKTNLDLVHQPLKSKEITEDDIIKALQHLHSAEKPALIHCWHGSDRTGVVTAAYRIVFEDWPKEKAIEELRSTEFGYHENWYPNLIDILNNLNVEAIKQRLKTAP